MTRPRWHDVALVVAILGLGAAGVWALWWDDVRALLHLAPPDEPAPTPAPPSTGA